nr:ribonuclease H-like domain-containing protein [Tanacetum cinerariifolium]
GHTQEEGIDYEEVFAPVARIEAIQLFLAYSSFMGFMLYQMDVKSDFLYRTIKEVYVCQRSGFEDPDYPDKQKDNGIFISQDKYVARILRKFGLTDGKSASTPIDTEKPLLKDPEGVDVDVHIYRLIITAISSKLMLFGLTKDDVHLILLDDADGIDCLPNEEIFDELARMGYEKPSTKLTFYKGMVRNMDSPSKFLMYPQFLQVMINVQVDDLSAHNTKYTSPVLTQKVFANMRRIGKGFSGVETLLFDAMLKDANLEEDKIAQALNITKLKQRVRKLEKKRRTKGCIQTWGKIADLDADEDVSLVDVDAKVEDTDETEPAKVEEVLEVVTVAKLMTKVVTTAALITTATQVPKASALRRRTGVIIQDPEETAAALVIVHSKVKSKDKGKGILIEEPKPLKVQARIDMDKEFTRQLEAELNENINWNDVMKQVKRREKQDNIVMRYQALKRKPLTEAQARKNMMIYLKNMAGFKMDFFKQEGSKRKGKNLEQDTAKKQRIYEDVEELKIRLQIVANDDDDVYIEATPLASKVPVIDYQIYHENNKPYYKIIKADGTYKLFLSFTALLKNLIEKTWKLFERLLKKDLNLQSQRISRMTCC